MASEHKTQITIAIIGVIGTIAVAIISNLDKFGGNEQQAKELVATIAPAPPAEISNNISAPNINTFSPKQFDGRIGKVFIQNSSPYPFKVSLWHPASKQIFKSWSLDEGTETHLTTDNQAINIGNDWGIQIGDSQVKPIDDASSWVNNEWRVNPNSYHE